MHRGNLSFLKSQQEEAFSHFIQACLCGYQLKQVGSFYQRILDEEARTLKNQLSCRKLQKE